MKHYRPSSELHRQAEENERNLERMASFYRKYDALRAKVPLIFVPDNWFIGRKQAG